ncbi:MAG: TetR/AcrR family transcriptional regulator [Xanthobacteraceae bacterium]
MSSKSRTVTRATSEETKNQIKTAARMLFAQRGVDGVTVQEIVNAAGQRNNAALHYHFGTKEDLIREMVVDGAAVLDNRRREMLDEMNARGGPRSIRDVVLVLVMPVIELGENERWRGYIRFTSNLQASDPGALRAALNSRWNSGYIDCFEYLRKLLRLPAAIIEQRLSFFMIYANAILSAHEVAQEKRRTKSSRLWGQPFTIENILDTLEAALTCPSSEQTQVKLLEANAKPTR